MKVVQLDELSPEGVSHDPSILKRVLVRGGEVPHLAQLARATFAPGQVAGAHLHADMCEIFLCESGVGRLTIAGREIDLVAGTCVRVDPEEVHELANTGDRALVVTVIGVVV